MKAEPKPERDPVRPPTWAEWAKTEKKIMAGARLAYAMQHPAPGIPPDYVAPARVAEVIRNAHAFFLAMARLTGDALPLLDDPPAPSPANNSGRPIARRRRE